MEDEAKSIVAPGGPIVPEEYVRSSVSNTQDVIDAVKRAKREKKVLRIVGSEHSVNAAIYPEDGITLVLKDDLRKVEILHTAEEDGKKWLYCRIGGGCYLGKDPLDPNSACYQVAVQGYGFPELGGIIHQSVGGFIMTGSAGGSLKHSFADVIQEIEFVDGNAQVQRAERGTDLWCAVGVSMGLFGVITRVTFRLPPMRVNWFPQKEVMRVQEWVGQQSFEKKDIVPYNSILSNILAAGMAAIALSICNFILQKKDPTALDYDIIGLILCQFVPLNDKPTKFYDMWYHALPMDNEAHVDTIIRVDFTEIWVPISQCQTVMDKLQKLFSENQKAANNFATEIYGAKSSPFWLSMSYRQDMVRVDPYWWATTRATLGRSSRTSGIFCWKSLELACTGASTFHCLIKSVETPHSTQII
mgnify:FL=1